MTTLILFALLQSAMPPLPPFTGHTLTLDVEAPTRELAERSIIRVYLDGLSGGVILAGVHCTPVIPTITATVLATLYACTAELPHLANGFHSLRHTIQQPGAIESPKSEPIPFVYQASAVTPIATNPRIQ